MRQKLFRNWRAVFIVFMAIVSAVAASTGPGYLRRVGPAPLRFLAVFQRPTNRIVLPAPAPAPTPAHTVADTDKPLPPPPPSPPPTIMASAPRPPISKPVQSEADTAPADGIISPQMFLKFFRKSPTNNAPGNGAALHLDTSPNP